jgi:hypothetical protein
MFHDFPSFEVPSGTIVDQTEEEEECIVFSMGSEEVTTFSSSSSEEQTNSLPSSSPPPPPQPQEPPFQPGDHVYQWCRIVGIPAFHHHGIVMQVYYDAYDEEWMLHISDFSNVSLQQQQKGQQKQRNPNSLSSSSPSPSSLFTTDVGSNPFLLPSKRCRTDASGSWRSYASPARRWNKVIYDATLWQDLTHLSPGTSTRSSCDPPQLVQARVQFLQLHFASLRSDKPYHWLHNNCESAAVWCKTGSWCTVQGLSFLTTTAVGQVKSTALLASAAVATEVTTTVPAAGIWGSWFGMTTTTTTSLLMSQPQIVIPAIAAYGMVAVGVPALMIRTARREWKSTTDQLNDAFWSDYALHRPEIFVECILQRQTQQRNQQRSRRPTRQNRQ